MNTLNKDILIGLLFLAGIWSLFPANSCFQQSCLRARRFTAIWYFVQPKASRTRFS